MANNVRWVHFCLESSPETKDIEDHLENVYQLAVRKVRMLHPNYQGKVPASWLRQKVWDEMRLYFDKYSYIGANTQRTALRLDRALKREFP